MGSLDVLRGILAKLVEDKFGDIYDDEQLCIATVVDPRFKLGLGPEIQIGSIAPRRPQPPRRGSDSTVDGDDTFTGQHQRWSRRI